MVLGGRVFERWGLMRCRDLMNEISALIKEIPESSHASSIMIRHKEKVQAKNQEEGSHQNATMLMP